MDDEDVSIGQVNEGSDYLRFCPVCEQIRHVTWFDVGSRGCRACQVHQKLWVAALSEALREARPPDD